MIKFSKISFDKFIFFILNYLIYSQNTKNVVLLLPQGLGRGANCQKSQGRSGLEGT